MSALRRPRRHRHRRRLMAVVVVPSAMGLLVLLRSLARVLRVETGPLLGAVVGMTIPNPLIRL